MKKGSQKCNVKEKTGSLKVILFFYFFIKYFFLLKRFVYAFVGTEDTIDNEHLNRKSSKACCIYHAPRAFDASSSDESTSSESSGGHKPEPYLRGDRSAKRRKQKQKQRQKQKERQMQEDAAEHASHAHECDC